MTSGSLISVVIPTWNESDQIHRCLQQFEYLEGEWELIVADGGSTDGTPEQAEALGACVVRCTERGRGPQQNAGAEVARGELLLFLHADAILPATAHGWITSTLSRPGVAAGAFRIRHAAEKWSGWKARTLRLADLRSHWTKIPYGDQGIFMKTATFRACGGFPRKPLMEDVALVRKLSRMGGIETVRAEMRVSGRRFEHSPVRAFLCMNTFSLLDHLGVHPRTLARLYGNPR
ncbi:MAG: TIGR04283 family arsenosugar biosynthesis glycosyltransferase [Holophagaceae bacterium]|nr:TIGR04283 family arsenosugar biosynthesis glycosyltransferase [Holophagaceae bacterium]